ncbi:hypothetical protein V6N12_055488 [Hibiscus sabdariffa]|uniref:Uncharacterized protein n=1 Tax=Hibiscus sabdariffa TaxID=183260 RepID=A0ABR2BTV1_9ROSI
MDLTRACSSEEEDGPSVMAWAVKVRVESVMWPSFFRPLFSFDFDFVLWLVPFASLSFLASHLGRKEAEKGVRLGF